MDNTSDRNWTADFEGENGNYSNRCRECKNEFIGHKRRVVCRVCAESRADKKEETQEEMYVNVYKTSQGDLFTDEVIHKKLSGAKELVYPDQFAGTYKLVKA